MELEARKRRAMSGRRRLLCEVDNALLAQPEPRCDGLLDRGELLGL